MSAEKRKANLDTKTKNNFKSDIRSKQAKNYEDEYYEKNYHLYILFAVLCILPFIVRLVYYPTKLSEFPWFPSNDYAPDFFLYYRQRFFLLIAAVMSVVILYKLIFKRTDIRISKIFIPLAIYAIFAILSTIFSEYRFYSLRGSYEQFESIFVLLGYCVVAYYTFLVLKSERDFQYVYYFLVVLSLIMSLLGVFQFFGLDFFNSELGRNIIVPPELRDIDYKNSLSTKVYLTLYNPNYVGMLGSLLIPIIFVMTLMYRKLLWTVLSVISIIGLFICVAGANSLSGVIAIAVSFICIAILLWRYIIKHYIIAITTVALVLIAVFTIGKVTDNYLYNKLRNALKIEKTEPAVSSIETLEDRVSITYKNEVMNVIYTIAPDNTASITAFDNNNLHIDGTYDPEKAIFTITDKRFEGIQLGFDKEFNGVFYVQIGAKKWRFTNWTEDQSFYFVNRFNKLDKMVNPPAAFTGYDRVASGRGYLWSRTIPLLKNYLLLGSGPDTFIFAFPQNDYLGFYQNYMEFNVLTKPHNLYLQIGVQTGVVSLIAFIAFYLAYFISSIRLYIRGRFNSFYARFGLAIFAGTIGYMFCALANDSSITIAPIFWLLIGAGIAVNYKAKELILREIAEIKEQKESNKTDAVTEG